MKYPCPYKYNRALEFNKVKHDNYKIINIDGCSIIPYKNLILL